MSAIAHRPFSPHPRRPWLRRARARGARRARLLDRPRRPAARGRGRRRAGRRAGAPQRRAHRRTRSAPPPTWSRCSSSAPAARRAPRGPAARSPGGSGCGRCRGPGPRDAQHHLPSPGPRRPARPPTRRPALASWQVWTCLWIVYIVWGSTYLAIRIMVETVPAAARRERPLHDRGRGHARACSRCGAAGACSGPRARSCSAPASSGCCCPGANAVVSVAEQEVPSSIAALLIASVPLWVILLRTRRPRRRVAAAASPPRSSGSPASRCSCARAEPPATPPSSACSPASAPR